MPLIQGKSEKAFEKNLKTEMHHGKPLKQSLAIAYAMKRKAKKRDEHEDMEHMDMAEGGCADEMMHEKEEHPLSKGMKKAFHAPGYAKGGDVKGVHKKHESRVFGDEPGTSVAGNDARWAKSFAHSGDKKEKKYHEARAKARHAEVMHEMHEMKGKDRKYLAEGGDVKFNHEEEESGYEEMPGHSEDDMGDLVERIMKMRMKHYSKGGRVANEDEPMADFEEAEFDLLPEEDDLEFHYTGKNSGDEDGDEAEDHDRKDIVERIMKSRKKKDRMPHPA